MSSWYYARMTAGLITFALAPVYCVYNLHCLSQEGTLKEVDVQTKLRNGR